VSDDFDGLTPIAELELRRRREAERQANSDARMNAALRGLYREHVRRRDAVGHAGKVGRPGWRRSLFRERYAEAEAATPEPRTPDAIALHFRGLRKDGAVGVDPVYLTRKLREADRGTMPE
jgi:hypothetical protein